jgi:hypothetical protein
MTTAKVMSYKTGEPVGRVTISEAKAESYSAGKLEGYQWPEGIAKAGDVFAESQIAMLNIDRDTVVFLEV